MNFRLELDETPPSLNRYAGGPRGPYFRAKKEWQQQLGTALMAAGVPRGLSKVTATATLTFPVRRRRDEGNLRMVLEKALGDILVEGGWLADDVEGAFEFSKLTIAPERGDSATVIELVVENSEPESRDQKPSQAAQPTQQTQRNWRPRVKG